MKIILLKEATRLQKIPSRYFERILKDFGFNKDRDNKHNVWSHELLGGKKMVVRSHGSSDQIAEDAMRDLAMFLNEMVGDNSAFKAHDFVDMTNRKIRQSYVDKFYNLLNDKDSGSDDAGADGQQEEAVDWLSIDYNDKNWYEKLKK